MTKEYQLSLIKRSLVLRHKIKVFESGTLPSAHEELADYFVSRWELEDELRAIEQLILEARERRVLKQKKSKLEKIFQSSETRFLSEAI